MAGHYDYMLQLPEEFNYDDIYSLDWLQTIKDKSMKNMNYTMSEVSKYDFIDDLLEEKQWDQYNFNRKAQLRQRNRKNAKLYRDKKKIKENVIQYQIRSLQEENLLLKKQKVCKWCQRYFENTFVKRNICPGNMEKDCYRRYPLQNNMYDEKVLEFASFEPKKNKSGKVWIALGLLMLVIGMHLYGLKGNNAVCQQIYLNKKDAALWGYQFLDNQKGSFNVRMQIKEERTDSLGKIKDGIGRLKDSLGKNKNHASALYLDYSPMRYKVDNVLKISYELRDEDPQDSIKIDKELLYSIQAYFDDVGIYI